MLYVYECINGVLGSGKRWKSIRLDGLKLYQ